MISQKDLLKPNLKVLEDLAERYADSGNLKEATEMIELKDKISEKMN